MQQANFKLWAVYNQRCIHTQRCVHTLTIRYELPLSTPPITISDEDIAPVGDNPNPIYPLVSTSTSKVIVDSSNPHLMLYLPSASRAAEWTKRVPCEHVEYKSEVKKTRAQRGWFSDISSWITNNTDGTQVRFLSIEQFIEICNFRGQECLFALVHWRRTILSSAGSLPPLNCWNLCDFALMWKDM